MEGETRTNVNYLEQLTKYHLQTGKSIGKIPQLDKRPIDLYKLKNEVTMRGGVQQVTRLKKWAEIGRILGYNRKQCTSLSNSLKSAYTRWVLPYEIWYAQHKDDAEQVLIKKSIYRLPLSHSLISL
jgi:histone demethylase JARID1